MVLPGACEGAFLTQLNGSCNDQLYMSALQMSVLLESEKGWQDAALAADWYCLESA